MGSEPVECTVILGHNGHRLSGFGHIFPVRTVECLRNIVVYIAFRIYELEISAPSDPVYPSFTVFPIQGAVGSDTQICTLHMKSTTLDAITFMHSFLPKICPGNLVIIMTFQTEVYQHFVYGVDWNSLFKNRSILLITALVANAYHLLSSLCCAFRSPGNSS